ncbi:MAG: histone deacetylase, partial [Methanomicrobiales archaeon]|nr:histone deacetylase [Methanomicrobiales archaeon]
MVKIMHRACESMVSMVACSVITGDIFARHDLPFHPENQGRLLNALSGVPRGIPRTPPVYATVEDIGRIHDPAYIRHIERLCGEIVHVHMLDSDTYVTPDSYQVALAAAGSAIAAAERSLEGECSFAMIRPPGHHAERNLAMGFCIFNNAAIAAARMLDQVDRVAIVDWDLHHGNGTQAAFYSSPRVLYCSVHDRCMFPGTGNATEIGEGRGKGLTVNAPLESGSTLADYLLVFSRVFVPVLARFRPQVCIISAGQDMLADDPLSSMRMLPEDVGVLT